jgi:hopene-associated glycosyltransferase HpnB
MLMFAVPIGLLSLAIWLYLLLFRGQFWRTDQRLAPLDPTAGPSSWPAVTVIIPARNEADVLPLSLTSLLGQTYPGPFTIVLVDDHSQDGTAQVAQAIAEQMGALQRLTILSAPPLPAGWTGKLWALSQGIAAAGNPDYVLLTDADIQHPPDNLQRLVAKATADQCDLVSLMVRLRCQSPWEKRLIPAFVFFFAKLYPFRWVNNPDRALGAAAGGCSLIRFKALANIGGIAAIKDALIDDCALAQKIKSQQPHTRIWLGLSDDTLSLRPYDGLEPIWTMVARTAYTQLNYSPLLLVGTVVGMGLIYLAAPIGIALGLTIHDPLLIAISALTYGLMAVAYGPMTRFYGLPIGYALGLPPIGLLYTLMTLDSARRHWQGQGGQWKGRTY